MKVWFITPDTLERAAYEIVDGVADIQGAVDAADKDLTLGPLLAVTDQCITPVLVLKQGSEQPQVFRPSPPAAAPVIQPPADSNPSVPVVQDDPTPSPYSHVPTDEDNLEYIDGWLAANYPDAVIERADGEDGAPLKADKLAFVASQG